MSDTPETDEQVNGKPCTQFGILVGDSLRDALIPSSFARKLERERDELKIWKTSAMEVLGKIQLQEIGKEIGSILGSDISEQILPAIKSLKRERDEARAQRDAWEKVALREASKNGSELFKESGK